MPEPTLRELLDVATEAAYLGGRRTLAYYNTPLSIETKSDNTPVTRADREAELAIREYIGRYFPSHAVVGEEHGAAGGDPRYRWIIDPIDGTKSFIHGVPLFGVLIGVEVDGESQVGVVYMPALDEMLCAARGLGCRWNGRPAKVSENGELAQATLLCGSPMAALRRSDAFERLASATKLQRGWGDCYGYVLVATGRADIMLDPAMNLWDCAPLLPILEEAGGRFSNWQGERTIAGPDAVGASSQLYPQVLEVLRSEKRR